MRKIIENYSNYSISEDGEIVNIKFNRPLVPHLNSQGYLEVQLSKDGKCKTKLIHRLVAQAFIPNPNNLPQVHHIDDDRQNCNVDNLKWGTNKENLKQRDNKVGRGKISKIKILKFYKSKDYKDIDDFVRKIIML